MPRGGKRVGAGRKGLTLAEKLAAAARLSQLIDAHYPIRERRAFARLVRSRAIPDDQTAYDELAAHYNDIARPSRGELAQMTEQEREDRAEARRAHLAAHRRNPGATAIAAFFTDLRLRRHLRVPGPTSRELGTFHLQIANELAGRLQRRISRRQVAEACGEVAALARQLREYADAVADV